MFVADRQNTDTLECRLSSKLYRREAGSAESKALDNPMYKVCLSGREEVEFSGKLQTQKYALLEGDALNVSVCT